MDTITELGENGEFDYFNYMVIYNVVTEKLKELIEKIDHDEFVNNNSSINFTCGRSGNVCGNTTYRFRDDGNTIFIEIPSIDNVIESDHTNALILFSIYTDDSLRRYFNLSPYDLHLIIKDCNNVKELVNSISGKYKTLFAETYDRSDVIFNSSHGIFDHLIDD